MQANRWKSLAAGLTAVLALAVFVAPAEGEGTEKQVRIKKIVQCEDGECTETVEQLGDGDEIEVVIADGDGSAAKKHVIQHRIECDGEDCEHHDGAHKMVFVGDDGGVRVMAGGKGHAWIGHSGGTYLGVGLTELTNELRTHFGAPEGSGVMVGQVVDGSPAFKAGVEVGDIITAINGTAVESGAALAAMIRGHEAGDEVTVSLFRKGSLQQLSAALDKRQGGLHAEHMEGQGRMRKIVVDCDSEDGDCQPYGELAGLDDFDCGGAEECEVRVQCEDGDCTCEVNGEAADCSGIPGVPSSGE